MTKNRDKYARATFLHQAAQLSCNEGYEELSQMYNLGMENISKKSVLKISPHLKREVCKNCRITLNPGCSSTIRIENNSRSEDVKCDVLTVTCRKCGTKKRFPIGQDPDFQLWVDRD
ncbi:hypothetical protein CANCADRAFT_26551 [Tortispora caseinolytica NRRL Y-17796]|uniref:Uncharacterized protein n=1 Tax=Tortispora caseinolytica NRRL Y-17796 TaxID=767744 RepID=A0A1E4TDT9_9ASCO|nr:hypothetical protein CANCADRAFT_26551 [Tortispora caseinolytica NRRL Y-17796]